MKILVPYYAWMKKDIKNIYMTRCPYCGINFNKYPEALYKKSKKYYGTINKILLNDPWWVIKGGIKYEWLEHRLKCKCCKTIWYTPPYPKECFKMKDIRRVYDVIFDDIESYPYTVEINE